MNRVNVNLKTDYIVKMTEIRERLAAGGQVLIASHLNPDGDAIGTQLAFAAYVRSLGNEPLLVRDDEIPEKYRFLQGVGNIVKTDTLKADFQAKTALIIECPNHGRIGKAASFLGADTDVLNIDHHPDNTAYGSVNWVNTSASSVGEMAFEFFQHVGFDLSPTVAEQLYTAIMTDTGRFRFPSTSRRTMEIIGRLIEAGADPRKITDLVYYDMSHESLILTGRVLSEMEFHYSGKLCMIFLTLKMLKESACSPSDTEGLVDYTLYGRGVDVGVLLRETEDGQTKVSLRSSDGLDVSKIAGRFGGGGHRGASGCTIELPIGQAKQHILDIFSEVFGASKE